MARGIIYMPIFRLRTEEKKVLLSRAFDNQVFPCVEIIKATLQKPRESLSKVKAKKSAKQKKEKSFEDIHLPILNSINARKVFVDLPVHLKVVPRLNTEVLKFMKEVVLIRKNRTDMILKLSPLANKIIPVISTYWNINNERNSILLQESDLRQTFGVLAFRIFPETIDRDLLQVEKVIKSKDYLIFDIGESDIDIEDPELLQPGIKEVHTKTGCNIIIVKSILSNSIKNNTLENGKVVPNIKNDLISSFKNLFGTAFGDYVGIKKDQIKEGGAISPGFIIYDPTEQQYFGYRGDVHTVAGKKSGDLNDFETIIVPQVLRSPLVKRMRSSGLPYLDDNNFGWKIIGFIDKGIESGKNQGKFKRISMEHYIHCIETDIKAGRIS